MNGILRPNGRKVAPSSDYKILWDALESKTGTRLDPIRPFISKKMKQGYFKYNNRIEPEMAQVNPTLAQVLGISAE